VELLIFMNARTIKIGLHIALYGMYSRIQGLFWHSVKSEKETSDYI